MADNFGNQQSRVVSPLERNWDQTVFLSGVPFLTSELNLIGQIGSLKSQESLSTIVPSGWMKIGDIIDIGNITGSNLTDRENLALSGQVLTSFSYAINSFKLISKDVSNIAIVNGWKIPVQGLSSEDTNNIITLPDISSHRVDFVFLEVWKELVDFEDIVYPYGNVLADPISTLVSQAEIYSSSIGVETTKRVQLRYRIRTKNNSSSLGISITANPDGFGSEVSPIGGRGPDNYNTDYEFVNQAPLDTGLWVSQPKSGVGSKTQAEMQTDLNTVDGYVYAIPMFAVYRREPGTPVDPFDYSNLHRSQYEKSSSKHSDRPDGRFLDVVHKEDIIDLRHQVLSPGHELRSIAQKTFRKIVSGEHTSIKGFGTGSDGGTIDISGGSTLLKSDRIDTGDPGDPIIGSPVQAQNFKRRAYCNASVINKVNILKKTAVGAWGEGQTFNIDLVPSDTPAVVTSIDGVYCSSSGFSVEVTGISNNWSSSNNKNVTFTISSPSNLIPGPAIPPDIFIEYTVEYQAGNNGFKDTPKDFLEVRKVGTNLPIATRDHILPIRGQASTVIDSVEYQGANYTDTYKFGHELVLYRTIPGVDPFTQVSLSSADFYGYDIVGVKSVQRKKVDGTYGSFQDFSIVRNGTNYEIESIGSVDEPNTQANLRITLYTKNKFFELSKQGRGIIDTYEMLELTAVEEPALSGNYFINTGEKPILDIGTRSITIGGIATGSAYMYKTEVFGEQMIPVSNPFSPTVGSDINSNFPIINSDGYQDNVCLPTKVRVATGLATGSIIKVPVLVHSYVLIGEGYSFFYKINPYQGNIQEEITGKIESEGPAAITSEGSGLITLSTYATGTVVFTNNSRSVVGIGTEWLSYSSASNYIRVPGSFLSYRIESIQSNTQLTLTEPYGGTGTPSGSSYEIFQLDVSSSGFTNVIDRMPTYALEDYLGGAALLDFSNVNTSYMDVAPIKKVQDPLETIPNDFRLGTSGDAFRGRNGITLTDGENTVYKLGNFSPEIEYLPTASGYKKVYQAYIFNKNNTGRLYLLIISGETNNTGTRTVLNGRTVRDTADIFELVGRPLLKTL